MEPATKVKVEQIEGTVVSQLLEAGLNEGGDLILQWDVQMVHDLRKRLSPEDFLNVTRILEASWCKFMAYLCGGAQ